MKKEIRDAFLVQFKWAVLQFAKGDRTDAKAYRDFNYFLNSITFGIDFPYKVEEVKKILVDVEKQTGFTLEGLSPVPLTDLFLYQD